MPLPTSCILVVYWADGTFTEFLVNGSVSFTADGAWMLFTDTDGYEHKYHTDAATMRGWKKKSVP